MANFKKKFKNFKSPDALLLICILMVIVSILTYLIPAGEYTRLLDPKTGREMVDPNSFHFIENTPVGPWKVLSSVHQGLVESSEITSFLFIIGGAFGVLNSTGALEALISRTATKLKGKEKLVVIFFVTLWALGGAFLGNFEECLAFLPMQITLCLALGFDSITGVVIGICGVAVGYIGGVMNPFTLGISQQIAQLPPYSGIGFRLVLWLVTLIVTIAYIYRYADKIHKNPQLSLSYEEDKTSKYREEISTNIEFSIRHKLILLSFILAVIGIVYGVIVYQFYLGEMAAVFILLTIIVAIISDKQVNDTVNAFANGAADLLYPCLCVGLARGLTIVMMDGHILDVIVHSLTRVLGNLPSIVSAPLSFIVISIINLFVPSGSGKAVIIMPILVPLADILGITRQTVALAFHMGDGITNLLSPAEATIMVSLGLMKISYGKWIKWFWKLVLLWYLIGITACIVAVNIGLGPF